MESDFFLRRVIIFAGHYGSGKTILAINCALSLAKTGKVSVCDLDIVNPYFKMADFSDILSENGVGLISSVFSGSNADIPALPPSANSVFDDQKTRAVIDLGGDEKGARALGRYAGRLNKNDYEMYLVINRSRPQTRDTQSLAQIKNEIEKAAGVRFTGIVNNTNLAGDTKAEYIKESFAFAREASEKLGLPVSFTAARRDLCEKLVNEAGNIFPVDVYKKKKWII